GLSGSARARESAGGCRGRGAGRVRRRDRRGRARPAGAHRPAPAGRQRRCFRQRKAQPAPRGAARTGTLARVPGDERHGNSVGAAVFLVLEKNEQKPAQTLRSVYWGSGWDDKACASALAASGFTPERLAEDALVSRAADAIHAGRVVGWFQGRMEFGPRALGNRSMLARPTDNEINKTLNARL